MESLVLVVNPGSASRKYSLYSERFLASLHFEYKNKKVICTLVHNDRQKNIAITLNSIDDALAHVIPLFTEQGILTNGYSISRVGLRVVAPGSFFLEDRIMNQDTIHVLEELLPQSPLHIGTTLKEFGMLRQLLPNAAIIGVSDSAFHATKPDYAWNYGISLADADNFEIKRFGYHGLSVESVTVQLEALHHQSSKVIVAHLGSGASITAVKNGKSIDNSMGYSPLEGAIMATRSGSIDITAALTLKRMLGYDDEALIDYLNHKGGLQGLGGSSDIRELLALESHSNHLASLALQTYIYTLQKHIGQMASALNGVDILVFTGTAGERSTIIRQRIVASLHYLGFHLNAEANHDQTHAKKPIEIHNRNSKPVYIVPSNEGLIIATHVWKYKL